MVKERFLLAFVAIILPLVTSAETVEIDGICYNVIAKAQSAEVVKKTSGTYSGEINIPSSVTYQGVNYSVTSIGNSAFCECWPLKSVTIPGSVISIGDGAFSGCSGLTSMIIPNGVTSIGHGTFKNCNGLTSVTIPGSVTSIGKEAFYNCSSLTSVNIPNSVTSIGEDAFYLCTGLTSVTIPNSVTSIGYRAFSSCTGLTSVSIGNGVASIGKNIFCQCTSLTSVVIPNSVTSIGHGAFAYCNGLTSVTIPGSVTSIDEQAFMGCSNLTSLSIDNGVINIGCFAFSGCVGLTSVTIPGSVTSIGDRAFSGCSGLTTMIIPNSVTSIGHGTFSGCSGLTSVAIPGSVTSIGGEAFSGCTGLTSVIIPNSVTSIGGSAFSTCSKLSKIGIGKSIKNIYSKAFANCENLTDITCLAKSVPSTATDAFEKSYIGYATLYVPESSIDAYKAISPWNTFKSIVAADIPMYSITYMVDGAVYKIEKYEEGDKITPEAEPTRDGYIFSGWNEIPETMPAHDVTVVGTFTVNNTKYTLTYMVDGEVYKSYQLKAGSTIIPLDEPTKEGYTFSGWSEIPEEMPAHDVTITGTFTRIPLGKCASPTVELKGGRIVFGCETEGVEFNYDIKSNVSLKGKGNDILVNPSISVSVYASKDGYDDSDITTKDILLSSTGMNLDANGDGVINAADVVAIVNAIMSEQQ